MAAPINAQIEGDPDVRKVEFALRWQPKRDGSQKYPEGHRSCKASKQPQDDQSRDILCKAVEAKRMASIPSRSLSPPLSNHIRQCCHCYLPNHDQVLPVRMLPTAWLDTMPGRMGAIIPSPMKSTRIDAQPSHGCGGRRASEPMVIS